MQVKGLVRAYLKIIGQRVCQKIEPGSIIDLIGAEYVLLIEPSLKVDRILKNVLRLNIFICFFLFYNMIICLIFNELVV